MAIAVQEAKKTIPDALGEVREAVDFCRYYAAQARSAAAAGRAARADRRAQRPAHGRAAAPGSASRRGTSRSPSSSARSAAALAAGNSVVAKPAPQTPRDRRAMRSALAHDAGMPEDALVLAVGRPRSGRGADRRRPHRRRRLHRLDRDRQAHRAHAARRRRPADRAADRRDRRDQRDDRRFDRSARTGGAGRRHLGLPLGRPALLGAARCCCCRRRSPSARSKCWRARWTA